VERVDESMEIGGNERNIGMRQSDQQNADAFGDIDVFDTTGFLFSVFGRVGWLHLGPSKAHLSYARLWSCLSRKGQTTHLDHLQD